MQLSLTTAALCMTTAFSNAQTVTQFASWSDGNAGGSLSPTVAFNIVNTNSILIATVYVDTLPPTLTDVRFGNGGGIGSGDVAPNLTFTAGRLLSYVFINPSTSSPAKLAASASSSVASKLKGRNAHTSPFNRSGGLADLFVME